MSVNTWTDLGRDLWGKLIVEGSCANCGKMHIVRKARVRNGIHFCKDCKSCKYKDFEP